MSTFTCDDKDTLIAYLYDEIDPEARRAVEDHLKLCAACADEVGALAGVRMGLAAWTPPHPEFGFTIAAGRTPDEAPAPAPAPSAWAAIPVWAQALAAVLVLAVSAGALNLQVRSGPDGFTVSTGWMTPAAPAAAAAPPADESWKPALAALESSLRDEIRATRADAPVLRASAPVGDAASLQHVQQLVEASEARQRRELALRMTQLTRDMDMQRRADLVRIEQGFGQFEGRTGAELARQRQLVNYLMRQPQQ